MKRLTRLIPLALPLLWGCTDEQLTSVATTTATPVASVARGLYAAYDVENRGASYAAPTFPAFEQLPTIRILPDPFRSFGGSVDLSDAGWSRRRNEIKASIEKYEIGPKPPPTDVDVTASYANGTLTVVVTRRSNQRSITFTSPILLPAGGTGPFPAIIGMTWMCWEPWFPCTGAGSLPVDIFTSRNIARISYMHNQATTYYGKSPNDPYFFLYPEYAASGAVGQYSAWSWGVSRLIDGIQLAARAGTLPIDAGHLGVTGCSYAGKMALFAGALDERIALTIAQESGGGGMPAWRVSQAIGDPRGGVEKIDNTDGSWFITGMKTQFAGDLVTRLPHDHHELMAMVAPRGLLATNNNDFIWLSNPAAYVSARAAQETYRTLGVADRFGFVVDGGHGHCAVPTSQRPAIEAFVDKFLLGQSVATDVQVHPFPELDYQSWMPWALRNVLAQFVANGTLSADQAAGLSDKLEAALASIAEGRTAPALNQLKAFTNQVNAFVNARALTPAQGAALIARIEGTRALVANLPD